MSSKINSFSMRTLVWILVIVLLILSAGTACSLPFGIQKRLSAASPTPTMPSPTATPHPTATPRPLPPFVVEVQQKMGVSIASHFPITFYFNQTMDQASVQGALTSIPPLSGTFYWEDPATLTFTPDMPLSPGDSLEIRLGTSAKAANGLSLSEPAVFQFHHPDYLKATQFLPVPESVDVDPASAIVATFNQPVVLLNGEEKNAPAAFTLSPSAPGQGKWVNSSTYIFYPELALAGGVTYTAKLSANLRSTANTPLEKALTWTFTTAKPILVSAAPQNKDTLIPLDASITLTFNQTLDTMSVIESFSLTDEEGEHVQGFFQWADDFRTMTFTPSKILARGTTYTYHLAGEAQAAGGTPLGTDINGSFTTTADLQLLSSVPSEGASIAVSQGITLYFNAPLDKENREEHLTLSPSVPNLRSWWNDEKNVLHLNGNFQALTEYTLEVSAQLNDKWGGTLEKPILIPFSTQALQPNLLVNYGTKDIFITAQESAIPIQGTNISQVTLETSLIPFEDFNTLLSKPYDYALADYIPPNAQTWQQPLNLPGDRYHQAYLPLTPEGETLSPGLYRYHLSSSELSYSPDTYLLTVTNTNLTLKISAKNILVWAVDLRTNQPIPDALITVDIGSSRIRGKTDTDGLFARELITPIDPSTTTVYAILEKPGSEFFGISTTLWQQGIAPNNYQIATDYAPPHPTTYLYTDRTIYSPGQTVYFRAVQREAYHGRYTIPQADTLAVSIEGAKGELAVFELPLSEYGTAHGEYTLSESAQPGYYRLETETDLITFQVTENRKPEIEIDLSTTPQDIQVGEEFSGNLTARYYFGAPARNITTQWKMTAQTTSFSLPGYQVGTSGYGWYEVASGSKITSSTGELSLALNANPLSIYGREIKLPAIYTLETTTKDENGFPVSARAETMVHPSSYYIGVRPDNIILQAGEEVGIDILVVDWNKQPNGIRPLKAAFQKITWEQTRTAENTYAYIPLTTSIASTDFSTGTDGKARLAFSPPESGAYELVVHGEDEQARTKIYLWVGGSGQPQWPKNANNTLELVADKDTYQPGDKAQIFIPNPFPKGAQALLTIERGKILSSQTFTINESSTTISIPLTEAEAPNVYVSVTLLGEDENGQPDFRQGYLNLDVSADSLLLSVELIGEPVPTSPGGDVELVVKVTDAAGEPVPGEFTLAIIDKEMLALAPPNSQGIIEAFYGEQRLGVSMGLPLTNHAGKWIQPPGGNGGGGSVEYPTIRADLPDTAYWNAEITTNEQGLAKVSLTLPDRITVWHAETRGVTKNTRVGQAETEIITTKDLHIHPVTPRFLVAGDHLSFTAIVHNDTLTTLQTDVALQTSGVTLDDPNTVIQTIEIPAGEQQRVEWWGTVENVANANLVFSAWSGELQDIATPHNGTLPVLRYLAPQTYGTSGTMAQPGEILETINLPRTFSPTSGSLDVEVSPSLMAAMLSSLTALHEKEHSSTVGTLSHVLPNLVAYQTFQEVGSEQIELKERLDEIIPKDIDALIAQQNEDGGWGWWNGSDSDDYITAYLLFGLHSARETGVFVDEHIIQKATDYLLDHIAVPEALSTTWELNLLAFEHFVLSEVGVESVLGMSGLTAKSMRLSPWAKALLALTLENRSPGTEQANALFSDLETSAIRSSTGASWEDHAKCHCSLNSPVSTTAIILYALARHDPTSPTITEATRFVMAARGSEGDWYSSYETSWVILALTQVMKSTGKTADDFIFSATLNGDEIISGVTGDISQNTSVDSSKLYPEAPNDLRLRRGEGKCLLYYRAVLNAFRPAKDILPFGEGMSLSRSYAVQDGEEEISVSGASQNELVTVRLTLTLEHEAYYVMVEDYIPAGAEIVATRIKTSQQRDPSFDIQSPFDGGWGWWWFNSPQVDDDHITWSADYLAAGTYELSYALVLTHPGEYQVLPAHAWLAYLPEREAISAGDEFEIR